MSIKDIGEKIKLSLGVKASPLISKIKPIVHPSTCLVCRARPMPYQIPPPLISLKSALSANLRSARP